MNKRAFAVSQYSGALNPVIHSGASGLPAPKPAQLKAAIQKVGFATSQYDAGPAPTWQHPTAPSTASGLPGYIAPRLDRPIQKKAAKKHEQTHPLYKSLAADAKYTIDANSPLAHLVRPAAGLGRLLSPGMGKMGAHYKLEGDAVIETDEHGKSLGKGPVPMTVGGKLKFSAGAPTRGGFMMASEMPSFMPGRLDQAIQKAGDFHTDPYTSEFKGGDFESKTKGKLKEKDSDALPNDAVMQPWDSFKRSKYAMPTEQLAEFVAELMEKDAIAGLTPATQLEHSSHIGAPRANAPKGPSIAQIAKPKGPGFGSPTAGAQKNGIGGLSVGGIGPMSSPPQL